MKKKLLILAAVLLVVSLPVMANDFGKDKDMGKGLTKLGAQVGSNLYATIGFDDGNIGEFNIFAGLNYGYGFYASVGGGVNYLFTLADINFGGQIFPLSLGPQVTVGYWWDPLNAVYATNYGGLTVEVLAVLRWEYTFWFPMNVYVQFGAGVGMNFGNSNYYNNNFNAGFAYDAAVGVRYVFGQ